MIIGRSKKSENCGKINEGERSGGDKCINAATTNEWG
jgi:hypothetical protein